MDLILDKDSPEAVEQLERGDYLALHQGACENSCGSPPSCAEGHFPEPHLQRETSLAAHATIPSAHHLIHVAVGLWRGKVTGVLAMLYGDE